MQSSTGRCAGALQKRYNCLAVQESRQRPPAGKTPDDVIVLPALNTMDSERTGWETQKPLALLERIIKGSGNAGDIVFDPFCGCRTAPVAAEKLGRLWLGADDDANAIDVVRERVASLKGIVSTDQAQFQSAVDALHRAPVRTGAALDDFGIIKDPTASLFRRCPATR